ncbi:hypothetical protein HYS48_00300, partial [Candidatus Woesearchaeota archaeon]|nr:hypothetical protein [Candidatus Woesearchaeota archaeon]
SSGGGTTSIKPPSAVTTPPVNQERQSIDDFIAQGMIPGGDAKDIYLSWSQNKKEWGSIPATIGKVSKGIWILEGSVADNAIPFSMPEGNDYRILVPNGDGNYDVLYIKGGERTVLSLNPWQQEQLQQDGIKIQYEAVDYRGKKNGKHHFYVKASGRNLVLKEHVPYIPGIRNAMLEEREQQTTTKEAEKKEKQEKPEAAISYPGTQAREDTTARYDSPFIPMRDSVTGVHHIVNQNDIVSLGKDEAWFQQWLREVKERDRRTWKPIPPPAVMERYRVEKVRNG